MSPALPASLPEKTWWGQLYRGLVVDHDAKHYRQMRSALWLFSYFVIHANRKDGTLRRKYETISRDMGLPLSTLRRWMTILKDGGYITVEQTGHAQLIHILKWKASVTGQKITKVEHPECSTMSTQSVHFRTRAERIGKPFPA